MSLQVGALGLAGLSSSKKTKSLDIGISSITCFNLAQVFGALVGPLYQVHKRKAFPCQFK